MAHCAVISLMNNLEFILRSDRFHMFHANQQVVSIYRKLRFLQQLLQDSLHTESQQQEASTLEVRIRDAAIATELLLEGATSNPLLSNPEFIIPDLDSLYAEEQQDLEQAMIIFDTIVEELMKERPGLKYLLPRKYSHVGSSRPARSHTVMVGFHDDIMDLKDRLTGPESKLQVVPIVGMGGIGKTTLARNLYDDSLIKYHFDVCAWVTISQTYLAREVVLGLLEDIRVVVDESQRKSIQDLMQILYKNLKGRRYLVVLDDMWNTEVWDDLKRNFPDDDNGSRIVLTTRLVDMADYVTDSSSPPHKMHLLDEGNCWDLICRQVFAEEGCPPEMEEIGRAVAHKCRGLPLAASVIGGLLANYEITREFWESVAENLNSFAIQSDEHCTEILSLSYNHLPHHLIPCFLYFGAFPEVYEISVNKIIRLWVAEGFLKPIRSKSFEQAAEEYLKDLIDRNLIFVRRKGSDGKIRTCGIHDLLRDLCIQEAEKENFVYIVKRGSQSPPEDTNTLLRVSMHLDVRKDGDHTEDIVNMMESMSLLRSFLCSNSVFSTLPFYSCFQSLRVFWILLNHFSQNFQWTYLVW